MPIRFVPPNLSHEADVIAFLSELPEDASIHGATKIRSLAFCDWIERTRRIQEGRDLPKGYVQATTFFVYDGAKLIGFANLRHELNDALLNGSGHLGYMVRKSERRKGYAKAILLKASNYYHEHFGLEKIMIVVDEDNIPSRKVLESLNALYYRRVLEDDKYLEQFWLFKDISGQ